MCFYFILTEYRVGKGGIDMCAFLGVMVMKWDSPFWKNKETKLKLICVLGNLFIVATNSHF